MRDLVVHESGVVLDFAQADFGGPDQTHIIRQWQQRPPRNGARNRRGEFICHDHRDHERPWLYLQQRGQLIVAAHWPGTGLAGTHEIHHHGKPSPEHERQVEYLGRAGSRAGFDVRTEVALPTGVRPDAIVYGPVLSLGVEVQRSALSAAAAKARTTKARNAGVHSMWTSDRQSDPAWLAAVPGVRAQKTDWSAVPPPGTVRAVSGVRGIVERRCRDMRHNRCPDRKRGCNRLHADHEPRALLLDELTELMPAGGLTPVAYRPPGSTRTQVFIVTPDDKRLYEDLTGRSGDLGSAPARAVRQHDDRRTCHADAGSRIQNSLFTAAVTPCPAHTRWPDSRWRCRVHGCPGREQP